MRLINYNPNCSPIFYCFITAVLSHLCLFYPNLGLAQSNWQRTYELDGAIHSFIEEPNQDLTLFNYNPQQNGEVQITMIRTDPYGTPLWMQNVQAELPFRSLWGTKSLGEGTYALITGEPWASSGYTNCYLTIVDTVGTVIKENLIYEGDSSEFRLHDFMQSPDGSLHLVGELYKYDASVTTNEESYHAIWLKISPTGELIWTKLFLTSYPSGFKQIKITPSGYFLLLGHLRSFHINDQPFYCTMLAAPNGDIVDTTFRAHPLVINPANIHLYNDGTHLLTGREIHHFNTSPNNNGIIGLQGLVFQKQDHDGLVIWEKRYESSFTPRITYGHLKDIKTQDGGLVALFSMTETQSSIEWEFESCWKLVKLNQHGEQEWQRQFPRNYGFSNIPDILETADGGFLLRGHRYFRPLLVKLDALGQIEVVSFNGRVVNDTDLDCLISEEEFGLEGLMVEAIDGASSYAFTGSDGHYHFEASPTAEGLRVRLPGNGYWKACIDTLSLAGTNLTDTIKIDFTVQPFFECPGLSVEVSNWRARPCFSSSYQINYRNEGTVLAENSFLELELDSLFLIDSASLAYTVESPNILHFDLGDLPATKAGTIYVYGTLSCEAEMGTVLCAEAHIFPDTTCFIPDDNWDRADLEVEARCEGDSVFFFIKNIGEGNMIFPSEFFIAEDDIILFQQPFQLQAEEEFTVSLLATGSTFHLSARQTAGHPFQKRASATIEGCTSSDEIPASLGFYFQFPFDDEHPFRDQHCQTITNSFDPNDKQASPSGLSDQHYIFPNSILDYTIRFQNTGTDTAFTVVILDTLDQNLDITSIQMGASSHTHHAQIHENHILEFTFNNIALPDSNVNEPASHGFIKFRIATKEGLAPEEQIQNTAAIYFDFNPPIFTNTTFHTIWSGPPPLISSEYPRASTDNNTLNVYPNPVKSELYLEAIQLQKGQTWVEIYDSTGKLWKAVELNNTSKHSSQQIGPIGVEDIPPGIYLLRVRNGKNIYLKKLIKL